MNANHRLAPLRSQIRALEGHRLRTAGCKALSFSDPHLNKPLPEGGLRLGALHEFCSYGLESELSSSVTAFVAAITGNILRHKGGFVLWAASRTDCYPPGFIRFGLDPERIIWVNCRKDAAVLGVMEEALRSRATIAVVGEAGALSLKTSQRLTAAAKESATTALLIRRQFYKSFRSSAGPCGTAVTRWRIRTLPSGPAPRSLHSSLSGKNIRVKEDLEPGVGLPRWRLDLEYCRNGRTAAWIVEALDGSSVEGYEAGHVRVVAELCDDTCATEAATACKAQRTARAS